MSCIRTVLVAAGVSFVIILPTAWFSYPSAIVGNENMVLNILVAIIAATAAIASACAAGSANKISEQIQVSARIRRTIDLSPYNSDKYIEAWEYLNEELEVVRNYKPSNFDPISWKLEDGLLIIDNDNAQKLKRKFLIVLNFWGRIATAHQESILEPNIAKNLYKHGFVRFINLSNYYLQTDANKTIYRDTLDLYDVWEK